MKQRIGIIGAGSLGTALVYLLGQNNYKINIFDYKPDILNKFLHHPKLKQIKKRISTKPLSETINNSDIIIPCLPSQFIDNFYQSLIPIYHKQIIISVSKGFYPKSYLTISQKVSSWSNSKNFVAFSGATFANEILDQKPTTCILASSNKKLASQLIPLFKTDFFLPQFSTKIIETELGGILKNCYAITFGILEHAGFGMNTKSLCLLKIMAETKKLYLKNKLDWHQIHETSFLGDLIATGFNPQSRNFQFGNQLKHNKKITVEGELNLLPLLKLAQKLKINLPILEFTQKIISQPKTFKKNINQIKEILLT